MLNSDLWQAPDVVPSITYADLPRAIEWLQRVFGFRERAAARLTWSGGGIAWLRSVRTEVDAWDQARNREAVKINWRFSIEQARIKLRRDYPRLQD